MSSPGGDEALSALLGEALGLPDRPVDAAFVHQVDAGVAEAERYRRWRTNMVRQLSGELLALVGIGGAAAVIAQAPGVGEALADAPTLIWPALLAMLLLWMLVGRAPSRILA